MREGMRSIDAPYGPGNSYWNSTSDCEVRGYLLTDPLCRDLSATQERYP
jgi:hypothetical protein